MTHLSSSLFFKTILLSLVIALGSCSEEARNRFQRQVQINLIGKDQRVHLFSPLSGQIIRTWLVEDGKITSGKTDSGFPTGYYYFYGKANEESKARYVQIPVNNSYIEEIN